MVVFTEWESLFVEVVGVCKNMRVGNVLLHGAYKTLMFSMNPLGAVLNTSRKTMYFTTSLLTRKLCPRHVFFGAGVVQSFEGKSQCCSTIVASQTSTPFFLC